MFHFWSVWKWPAQLVAGHWCVLIVESSGVVICLICIAAKLNTEVDSRTDCDTLIFSRWGRGWQPAGQRMCAWIWMFRRMSKQTNAERITTVRCWRIRHHPRRTRSPRLARAMSTEMPHACGNNFGKVATIATKKKITMTRQCKKRQMKACYVSDARARGLHWICCLGNSLCEAWEKKGAFFRTGVHIISHLGRAGMM